LRFELLDLILPSKLLSYLPVNVNFPMPSYPSRSPFSSPSIRTPEHYLIAHSDGGARGNPGPAGYGVVIQDQTGRRVAALSEYLGHQTNNFAEYQGLIAALEYTVNNGNKALKVVSDSELLVRQIKGIYKVKNATLQELHARAKELISQLDWFSIDHALREHNLEADDLANRAMDKGTGKASRVPPSADASTPSQEFEGVVRDGIIKLIKGELPEGTRVQIRVKR
jgi:ribonuclease HI